MLDIPTVGESRPSLLDAALPPALRERIEQRYWAPIGAAAAIERFIDDPALEAAPDRHPALFSDHGVVHVRDIAASALALAGQLRGTLIAERADEAHRFVAHLAVLLAYFHDIGMVEPSAAGRRVHPQFAAQTVLGEDFDDLAEDLWHADAGGLKTRLGALDEASATWPGPPAWVAREVMALSLCHSKSAVPAALLGDRRRLARLMRHATLVDLAAQHAQRLSDVVAHDEPVASGPTAHEPASAIAARCARHARGARQGHDVRAGHGASEPFAWLADDHPAMATFVDEVLDAVRLLRAADALRQRGTTLRTSAGYEVCTDRETGEAVVGLRTADQRCALLFRFSNPISAAEANLRATTMTREGHLRIEFYRGGFRSPAVRASLLDVTADVIADIEADTLMSFSHAAAPPPAERCLLLGSPADDARFAPDLAARLAERHPRLAGRIRVVPDDDAPEAGPGDAKPAWLQRAEPRSLDATAWDELVERLARHGLQVESLDRRAAQAGTRVVHVPAGTTVLEAGRCATFVVVPLGPGLTLMPLGGYASKPLPPWMPVGVTGVVRGGERNAQVVAREALDLLWIDGEQYLAEWFRPYDLPGLRRRLALHGLDSEADRDRRG